MWSPDSCSAICPLRAGNGLALHDDTRSPMMEAKPAREMPSSTSRRNELMRKVISTLMALALTALPALAAPDNDTGNGPAGKCGHRDGRDPERSGQHPAGPAGQGGMRRRFSLRAEICDWIRRKLRPRRDGLPQRRTLHRALGRAFDDGAGGRKLRVATGRPGNRFRPADHESARRAAPS